MTANARRTKQYRARHAERARITAQITNARQRAAVRVAHSHPDEFEAAIQEQCQLLGIPRYLPPLPPSDDHRTIRHTLEDGQ